MMRLFMMRLKAGAAFSAMTLAALPPALILAALLVTPASGEENGTCGLNPDDVTTSWNLTYLFPDVEAAEDGLARMQEDLEEMNATYRPKFENLTGGDLLAFIEDEKNLSRDLDNLWRYAMAGKSLDVNDGRYADLVSGAQDLYTNYSKAMSFVEIKLKSFSDDDWERLFAEEPGLEAYREYLDDSYIRYRDHKPRNETHAAYIADLANRILKIETESLELITNNVTRAGEVTLTNGEVLSINSQSYYDVLQTDPDRENRRIVYEKRFYHLENESERMAPIYVEKARLDDRIAREMNYSDSYEQKMHSSYLEASQIDEMNAVFKERKAVFEPYHDIRMRRMGLRDLRPWDIFLQLMKDPGKMENYTEALADLDASFAGMDPAFREIFYETATGGYIDVFPNPEGGKEPGGWCADQYSLGLPAIIFLNFEGSIDDKKTITHEMGHAICDSLRSRSVDYLYCGGTTYENEIPSTFNEELLVDYVIENSDRETALAMLADQIRNYENTFTFQPMISEFEREAHKISSEKENVTAQDLNEIWVRLDREYRGEDIVWLDDGEIKWPYIRHIFGTGQYYTFNYALSESITLALFKMYKEDPEVFNRNYVAYLSAGETMKPPEKLDKYFGIKIDRDLFEDAMDIVQMRIEQLEEMEKESDEASGA